MKGNLSNGIIAWFAKNHVAANLLMLMFLVMGAISLMNIKQEVFPEVDLDMVTITVPYPGATPDEVEEAICTRIEESIVSVDGIKTITSRASEGVGTVIVELETGTDVQRAADDIQAEVDLIDTFPENAEDPRVSQPNNRRQVINLVIYGDVPERTLKVLAEKARDELTETPGITQADVSGVRNYEIAIEVSEETLRRFGITFDQIVAAVKRSSLDLPGGSVKTDGGEILIRTKGQRYEGAEFEDINLITRLDGTTVKLGDVASVIDGFDEDTTLITRYDGKPATLVQVFRVGEQDAIDVADKVKSYITSAGAYLPAGVQMGLWNDSTDILKSRRDLLLRNGASGLILVFGSLLLFLSPRLAFWVTMGIPISFLGGLWLMPYFDTSLNMVSLFAFIVALGIVVDDAIVVGENIYAHWEEGKSPYRAAVDGAIEMAVPVVFAVLTTVVAFMPLLYVEGTMGKFMKNIPIVVIAVFVISLIESLLILPAHLAAGRMKHHKHNGEKRVNLLERFRRLFGRSLDWFIRVPYGSTLRLAVNWRYFTVAVFFGFMVVTLSIVGSGKVRFTFFPKVESDVVTATLQMPLGTSIEETGRYSKILEESAQKLRGEMVENGKSVISHIFSLSGGQTASRGPFGGSSSGDHLAQTIIQLTPSEERNITSENISKRWRELVGDIPDAESLTFAGSLFSSGNPIDIQLRGNDMDTLLEGAEKLKVELAKYPGVFDIEDSFREGKMELKMKLKESAANLGLTLADLAHQVRQGYYGEDALTIQRGKDDIDVVVRYPKEERRSLGDVEKMRIRTASGAEVPFSTVAEVTLGRGYANINRQERKRVISVTADIDEKNANAAEVVGDLKAGFLPRLADDYPGLSYAFEGHDKRRAESMNSLKRGFIIALFGIYLLLAIPFKTYTQPLIVMTAIPFGIVGAVWGHIFMGMDLTILSMFGIVALSGVVVNDSLILIDYINRAREKGTALHTAVMESGIKRFRPILLTTLTTFFGLLPMLLEKSVQAKFLIPMAVSLGFGIVTATTITLILIPCLYTILEDFMNLYGIKGRRWEEVE